VNPDGRRAWSPAFQRFAWSQASSQLAAHTASAAIPLLALTTLHVQDTQVGLLSFAQFLPVILLTLLLGAIIDSTSKVTPMLIGHAGRAIVFALLAVLAATGTLQLPTLLAAVFLAGALTAAFDVAVQGIVPYLAPSAKLVEANRRIQLTYSLAQVLGPTVAGALVGLGHPALAFVAISIVYAGAFLFLLPVRATPTKPESPLNASVFRLLKAGLRFSFSDRVLRRLLIAGSIFNLTEQALITTFLVRASRDLGISAGLLGVILSAGGLGAVVAAAAMRRAKPRSPAVLMVVAMSAATLSPILLLFVSDAGVVDQVLAIMVFFLYGSGLVVYNVLAVTLRQQRAPQVMRSRIGAVYRFFAYGSLGFGGLVSSALIAVAGAALALVLIVAGMTVATVVYASSLLRVRREIDDGLLA